MASEALAPAAESPALPDPERQAAAFAASAAMLTSGSKEPLSLASSVDVVSLSLDFGVGSDSAGDEFDKSDPTECLRVAGDSMMSIPLEKNASPTG